MKKIIKTIKEPIITYQDVEVTKYLSLDGEEYNSKKKCEEADKDFTEVQEYLDIQNSIKELDLEIGCIYNIKEQRYKDYIFDKINKSFGIDHLYIDGEILKYSKEERAYLRKLIDTNNFIQYSHEYGGDYPDDIYLYTEKYIKAELTELTNFLK